MVVDINEMETTETASNNHETNKQNDETKNFLEKHLSQLNYDEEIYKFGNSVYLFRKLDFDHYEKNFSENFLLNIFTLLDKGNKFIPCYFSNTFYFYSFISNLFKDFLTKLNSRIFYINKDPPTNPNFLYLTRNNLDFLVKKNYK